VFKNGRDSGVVVVQGNCAHLTERDGLHGIAGAIVIDTPGQAHEGGSGLTGATHGHKSEKVGPAMSEIADLGTN
jgi:hypothetical protein